MYDWRILAAAFGAPAGFMAVAASLGYLGASGIAYVELMFILSSIANKARNNLNKSKQIF